MNRDDKRRVKRIRIRAKIRIKQNKNKSKIRMNMKATFKRKYRQIRRQHG